MRKTTFYLICLFVFASCDSAYSETPKEVNQNLCNPVDNTFDEEGGIFVNLEMGKSTSSDLVFQYGEPVNKQEFKSMGSNGLIYHYVFEDSRTVNFIVIDGILAEVDVLLPGYLFYENQRQSVSLEDIVSAYGKPQLVGYDVLYFYSRIIVWPSHGMQISIFIKDNNPIAKPISINESNVLVNEVMYFAPLTSETYVNCFYSRRYSEELPSSDVFDGHLQDPFSWEK